MPALVIERFAMDLQVECNTKALDRSLEASVNRLHSASALRTCSDLTRPL